MLNEECKHDVSDENCDKCMMIKGARYCPFLCKYFESRYKEDKDERLSET